MRQRRPIDVWPEMITERLGKLSDAELDAHMGMMDWAATRLVVRRLPPSWRLAVLRVWTAGLLTSSRTGQRLQSCLFCGEGAADHFRHLVRCAEVRAVTGRMLRRDLGGASLRQFLGLDAPSLTTLACPVFLSYLYQKRRHAADVESAAIAAKTLLLHPLSAAQKLAGLWCVHPASASQLAGPRSGH